METERAELANALEASKSEAYKMEQDYLGATFLEDLGEPLTEAQQKLRSSKFDPALRPKFADWIASDSLDKRIKLLETKDDDASKDSLSTRKLSFLSHIFSICSSGRFENRTRQKK